MPEESKRIVPRAGRSHARSDILVVPKPDDLEAKLARSFDQRFDQRYRGGMRYGARGIRHHEAVEGHLVSHGSTINDNDGDLEAGAASSSLAGNGFSRR